MADQFLTARFFLMFNFSRLLEWPKEIQTTSGGSTSSNRFTDPLGCCLSPPSEVCVSLLLIYICFYVGCYFFHLVTNLILGLNRVAAFISEADFWIIRGTIYFCSGTIGCILAVMSLFNVYHVMFHKRKCALVWV